MATSCEILVASTQFFSRISNQEGAISDPVTCLQNNPHSPLRELQGMARKDHYYLNTALPVGLRSAPSFFNQLSVSPPPPPLPVRPAHKFTLIPFVTHLCNTGSYGSIMLIWQHLTTFTLSLAVSWTFWLCQSFTKV